MSLIDDFLNNSHAEVDATMGTKTMVCAGQTFAVVWDDYSSDSDGGLGGPDLGDGARRDRSPRLGPGRDGDGGEGGGAR